MPGELQVWPGEFDWYCPQNNVPFWEPEEEWIEEEDFCWVIKNPRKNKTPFVKRQIRFRKVSMLHS